MYVCKIWLQLINFNNLKQYVNSPCHQSWKTPQIRGFVQIIGVETIEIFC